MFLAWLLIYLLRWVVENVHKYKYIVVFLSFLYYLAICNELSWDWAGIVYIQIINKLQIKQPKNHLNDIIRYFGDVRIAKPNIELFANFFLK